ncbi:MAG: TlpA family protein disulfide reductase, partial [Acidaminococcaceae bacterium]|nr:TlpA family protein disulfide reductase [Acidaminococcaceae bacterium]
LLFTGRLHTAGLAAEADGTVQGTQTVQNKINNTDKNANQNKGASIPAVPFTLTDQYGRTHTLSQYKGKVIFLNFWATWCPPCRAEMPDIQKLYERSPQEGEDAVTVLGVASPGLGNEKDEAGIKAFMKENGYTYPVLMDKKGELFRAYGIRAIPTTYMIDRNGNLAGRVQGALSAENLERIVKQVLNIK